jgi:hypothetical protein
MYSVITCDPETKEQSSVWKHKDTPPLKKISHEPFRCSTVLPKLAENGLQYVFEKWVERCKKCIACQRRYFEKETVTAPPQSSDSEL